MRSKTASRFTSPGEIAAVIALTNWEDCEMGKNCVSFTSTVRRDCDGTQF
jgi:hypothetical protein